jgi:hypothetical protein
MTEKYGDYLTSLLGFHFGLLLVLSSDSNGTFLKNSCSLRHVEMHTRTHVVVCIPTSWVTRVSFHIPLEVFNLKGPLESYFQFKEH